MYAGRVALSLEHRCVIDVDPAYLLMIIPQLLDLSTSDWSQLIYFNINHVNDVPAGRFSHAHYIAVIIHIYECELEREMVIFVFVPLSLMLYLSLS